MKTVFPPAGHHVIENENRHIVCGCGAEFGPFRPAVNWRMHAIEEQRKVEEVVAQEIAETLGLTIPHDWERDEEGSINIFAFEMYQHNGPRCVRCNETFCEHCNPEMWGEPCDEQTPNLF